MLQITTNVLYVKFLAHDALPHSKAYHRINSFLRHAALVLTQK